MVVIGPMVFHANNAAAHVFPRKESPAAGATVEAPAEVSIRFDGPLEPSFSTLTVSDSSGKRVSTGDAKVDPQQPTDLSVKLPSLAPGHYTVQWAAVASDGHRTHGDYPFDVK
ncbi:MAG TPA: copper resistance protein CopC [Paraburkholderia sp.]